MSSVSHPASAEAPPVEWGLRADRIALVVFGLGGAVEGSLLLNSYNYGHMGVAAWGFALIGIVSRRAPGLALALYWMVSALSQFVSNHYHGMGGYPPLVQVAVGMWLAYCASRFGSRAT